MCLIRKCKYYSTVVRYRVIIRIAFLSNRRRLIFFWVNKNMYWRGKLDFNSVCRWPVGGFIRHSTTCFIRPSVSFPINFRRRNSLARWLRAVEKRNQISAALTRERWARVFLRFAKIEFEVIQRIFYNIIDIRFENFSVSATFFQRPPNSTLNVNYSASIFSRILPSYQVQVRWLIKEKRLLMEIEFLY